MRDLKANSCVRGISSNRKYLNEYNACKETTDVGRIGHATELRTASQNSQTANQLEGKPNSDRHVGGNLGNKTKHDCRHATTWIYHEVTTENAGDRSRSSEAGYQETGWLGSKHGRRQHVSHRCQDAANKIKDQIAQVAHSVLDVIAKDPEEKHVPGDVCDAPMHEHRNEQ